MPEEENNEHYHQSSRYSLTITFSSENIQIKGKHDRPLY